MSQRTGLTPHAIRAWERRYDAVSPDRSSGGTRLYTAGDILRLRLLRQATEQGISIGRAAAMSAEELLAVGRPSVRGGEAAERKEVPWQTAEAFTLPVLAAIEAMDGPRIQEALKRAMMSLGVREFSLTVAVPLLHRVGELWETEEFCPAHEHLFSARLRNVLGWLLESLPSERSAPGVVATTLQGESHELGAMLAGVTGASEGWRVTYLGPDLPPLDIATAVRATGSAAVLISVVAPISAAALLAQTRELRDLVPPDVHLLMGGAGAAEHTGALSGLGVRLHTDLSTLGDDFRSLDPRVTPSELPGSQ